MDTTGDADLDGLSFAGTAGDALVDMRVGVLESGRLVDVPERTCDAARERGRDTGFSGFMAGSGFSSLLKNGFDWGVLERSEAVNGFDDTGVFSEEWVPL